MFFEYLFKEMIASGNNRIENLFKNYFFKLQFFNSVINLKIGSLLLYLFIICFYFCLFLLLKFGIKKRK